MAHARTHKLQTPPLQAARFTKRGSRESELGVLAVDALHKQVMPFVLRRTKAQVGGSASESRFSPLIKV